MSERTVAMFLTGTGHNHRVTVHADRRLALLAMGRWAGLGGLVGLVVGVGMTLDGESKWSLLGGPAALALLSACSLGVLLAVVWWLLPGTVTYVVADGFLTARRGRRVTTRIPVGRIADVAFDEEVGWADLVFSGWFGWTSSIPALEVTMSHTSDRWDPTNGSVVALPRILLSGARQAQALETLRSSVRTSA